MSEALTVYIGYDPREHQAYKVCRASILRHATIPVRIVKLDRSYISRPFHKVGNQMVDDRDGRPFSTEFAFSRFMVPALSKYRGWAIFVDCDFLFTADIATVLPFKDEQAAVMVVKHDHRPTETVKMDGVSQVGYARKNWSSFVLWNCAHPSNAAMTPEVVNVASGQYLHGFGWLLASEIGALPKTWNWLSGVNEPLAGLPRAIHFTLGIPTMPGHENSPYADLWRDEATRLAKENDMGTSRKIRGPKMGAGMVKTGGPGKMAKRVTAKPAGGKFTGGANSYKPSKMSVQKSGE